MENIDIYMYRMYIYIYSWKETTTAKNYKGIKPEEKEDGNDRKPKDQRETLVSSSSSLIPVTLKMHQTMTY